MPRAFTSRSSSGDELLAAGHRVVDQRFVANVAVEERRSVEDRLEVPEDGRPGAAQHTEADIRVQQALHKVEAHESEPAGDENSLAGESGEASLSHQSAGGEARELAASRRSHHR